MAQIAQVLGVQGVLNKLKKQKDAIGTGLSLGLRKAGLRLQRESQLLVPVDLGMLKNSAFTRSSHGGFQTVVTVGYTASYALYVHEKVGMVLKGQARTGFYWSESAKGAGKLGQHRKGKYWDPQGRATAKFLEEPARRLRPLMRADIQQHAKVNPFLV